MGVTSKVNWPCSEAMSVSVFKRSVSVLGAGFMTLGLIVTMTQLISNDLPVLEKETHTFIPSFVPEKIEKEVNVIEIDPVMPETAPVVPRDPFYTVLPFEGGDVGYHPHTEPKGLPTPPVYGLPGGMALVPIAPRFPAQAIRLGRCGHVIVQYDIAASGVPMNVTVLESSHRVFNKNAVTAVQRARFKPNSVGGKPAPIYGKQEQITFRLEDGC